MDIAYTIKTNAQDEQGRPIRFQSLDRERAMKRLEEVKRLDSQARILGIPVAARQMGKAS